MPPRGEASSGVKNLVASCRQHSSFRALASYSVQCLMRAVTPPTPGWERNMREAYEAGALEAIAEIVSKHKNDPNVVSACTACLASIATDTKYAEAVADSSAVMNLIEAVAANPSAADPEGTAQTLRLLETIATSNPEALLRSGGLEATVKLLKAPGAGDRVQAVCARTLEKMNRVAGGTAKLIECGGMEAMMALASKEAKDGDSTEAVEASLRMLERVCRSEEHADYIRTKMGGMEALCKALEVNKSNERICKQGGRVLTKLAAGGVDELVSRMESSTSAAEKEFLSNLVANLAIEEDNAERLVKKGGVGALLRIFEHGGSGGSAASKKTLEASARALTRLATNEASLQQLVKDGAVSTIVKMVDATKTDKDGGNVLACLIPTLNKLVNYEEGMAQLKQQGAIKSVLGAMDVMGVSHEQSALESLNFLENMATSAPPGEDSNVLEDLVAKGCIASVIKTMKAHPKSYDIQLQGTRILIYVSYDEANVSAIVNAGALKHVIDHNLNAPRKDVVLTTLYLLTSISLVQEHKDALAKAGAADKLLTALSTYGAEDAVKDTATELLHATFGPEQVAETVSKFSDKLDTVLKTRNKADLVTLREMADRIAGLAATKEFAELMAKGDAAKQVVRSLESLAKVAGNNPSVEAEAAMAACGNALFTMGHTLGNDPVAISFLASQENLEGVSNAIKAQPKLVKHVTNAIKFFERLAGNPNLTNLMSESGTIEAVAAAMRANLTDPNINALGANCLLALASNDNGAAAVAKHGGTRQVIANVHANTGTPGFTDAMGKALALLQRVAMTQEGAEALTKQGGVEAVIAATEALAKASRRNFNDGGEGGNDDGSGAGGTAGGRPKSMRGKPGGGADGSAGGAGGNSSEANAHAAALAASSKVLSKLLTMDDVETAIEELKELAGAASKGRLAKGDVMLPILSKVGHMATVPAFGEALLQAGCAGNLAAIANTVLVKLDDSKPDDAELKRSALSSVLKALSGISRHGLGSDADAVTAIVGRGMAEGHALLEGLEVIRHLAASSEAAAAVLCNDGKTLDQVINALRNNQRDPEIATACFHALAALASHDLTAPMVAASPALGLVSSWIDDNLEDASRETVEAALLCMANLARSPPHADQMLESGAVELVKAVLVKVCEDSEVPAPSVLAASVNLLRRLGTSPTAVTNITNGGGLRRVIRCLQSRPDYLQDEACASAVAGLISDIAAVAADGNAEAQEELNACNAQDVVIQSINSNSASDAVASAGAKALQALGVNGDAISRAAIDEVHALCAGLEEEGGANASASAADKAAKLGEVVQRLGNMLLIPGSVDPATIDATLRTLAQAVAALAESDSIDPMVLASAVQTVARLVEQGGAACSDTAASDAVNVVMDVMCLNQSNPAVREATIHALGCLAASPEGLKALSESGALKTIAEVAKANLADSRLQQIVDNTMNRVAESVGRNVAELVASTGGTDALASVVEAASASQDINQLNSMLCSIVACEGGDEALYEVVGRVDVAPELMSETLRVLRDNVDNSGVGVAHFVGTFKRATGLTKTLGAALSAQAALTPSSDQRTKMQALRMAENTLTLMSRMDFDEFGAKAFFEHNGIQSLVSLLGANFDDEDTVGKIMSIMSGAMNHANNKHAQNMASPANMGAVVGCLKMYHDNSKIAAAALNIMSNTARTLGADNCGIDAESMRLATSFATSETVGGDPAVQEALAGLQAAFSGKMADVEAAAAAIKSGIREANEALGAVSTIQALTAPDGRTYYFDSATGETTWEAPAAYAQLKSALEQVSAVAAKQGEETVAAADAQAVNTLLNVLSTHTADSELATHAAQTLSTLASNAQNAEMIVASGGIEAAIAAIQTNPDNVALLRVLVILMERISRNDAYKQQIVAKGGLDLIISLALTHHVANEDICNKSLSTIANLAFNSEANIAIIMEKNAVKSIEKALQTWPHHARIMENAMCALSNLMYGSDENKLIIGQTCGDEVTKIIRDHIKDANLFKMAMRALGNLAYCDENIRFIVEGNGATKAIVAGMRAHPTDDEALQLAMEVIGNFASLEEDVGPDLDDEGKPIDGTEKESIAMIILRDAGCAEILATMKKHPHNSALLKAGMDALCNIANDLEVTSLMAKKQGLIKVVIDIMLSHDWDEEIIKHAVQLLATICYSRECLPLVAANDGLQVLLAAMEQHGTNNELIVGAQLALTNLAGDENTRSTIKNLDAVKTLMGLMEGHLNNKVFINEVLKTLTRLCGDDELSKQIASTGMHIIMAALDKHARDAEFLTDAFRLLGHLAFVESNLTVIVQHDGIKKIISAIIEHPDHQPLMLRSIQTIDNIAMANKENAAIVIEEGGKDLIEMIMEQENYQKDADIQRYGKSALLSMSALENLSKSAEITAKAAKASAIAKLNKAAGAGAATSGEAAKPADPLAEYRNQLSAGKVMKVWTKGSSSAAHVLVSPDFKSVVWQEVGTQKKLGALDLRQVTAIKAGLGEGHKGGMFGSKPKDESTCFIVAGERISLDLECTTQRDAKTWVEALNKLLVVYKTTPHLL